MAAVVFSCKTQAEAVGGCSGCFDGAGTKNQGTKATDAIEAHNARLYKTVFPAEPKYPKKSCIPPVFVVYYFQQEQQKASHIIPVN